MAEIKLEYHPFPTTQKFHADYTKRLRAIMGPYGSGKSVACVEELFFIAMRQKPASDGVRYTRMGAIRSTYPLLESTTKDVLESWLPPGCGSIKKSIPMSGVYKFPLADGTTVNMEIVLLAIQTAEDVEKLRSFNFTAIWLNEPTEVSQQVLTDCFARIGRYPSHTRGDCSWAGIIMDYNKPAENHWLHKYMEGGNDLSNDDCALYVQPPAAFKTVSDDGRVSYTVNPDAENLDHLGTAETGWGIGYYQDQINAKIRAGQFDQIDQILCLLTVRSRSGKAVFPMFSIDDHVSKEVINPEPGVPVLIGIDTSGIHPAAVLVQNLEQRWCILDEFYGEEMGFQEFVDSILVPVILNRYQGSSVLAICDPANQRNSLTLTSPVGTLQDAGIPAVVAPTNSPKHRIEATSKLLSRRFGGLYISKACSLSINALNGDYHYRKMRVTGTTEEIYSDVPEKNTASHIADAIEYVSLHIISAGESDGIDVDAVRKAFSRVSKLRRII